MFCSMLIVLRFFAFPALVACADCEASGCASKSNQLLQSAKQRKLDVLEHMGSSVTPMLEMVQSFAELISKEGNLTDSQKQIVSRLNHTFYSETLPTITDRHNNDTDLLKVHVKAVGRCNTDLATQARNASALQNAASLAKEAAQGCATEEAAAAAAKISADAAMTTFLTSARPPASTMPEPRAPTPQMDQLLLTNLQFWESFNNSYFTYKAKMSAAVSALEAKERSCNTKDASYKAKYCTWSSDVRLIKSSYATCRSEASALYNKTLATALSNMQGRKADFQALKKVECFLKVLLAPDSASASALSACETQGVLNTTALDIVRPVLPALATSELADLGEPNVTACLQGSGEATTSTTTQLATTSTITQLASTCDHSWDFRSGSGTRIKDEKSDLMATVHNPQWTSQGLHFNGKNTFVQLEPWALGGEITFEVFCAFDQDADWSQTQFVFQFSEPGIFHLRRNAPQDGLGIFQNREQGVSGYKQAHAFFWQRGKWTHVVCTFSAQQMKLFVDGRLLHTVRTGYDASVVQRNRNWIGRGYGLKEFFHGTIAYMRVWQNVNLDAAAVQELYNARSTHMQA